MFRRLLVPALFLILPMGMLYPLWTSPTSAGEDDVVYYYPLRTMVAGQVRSGQLPVWNSGEAAGVGLLADPQSGLFFPPNWLFLFLPAKLAYSLTIFLAFAVAGGGAYLYLRRIGLVLPAAIFGALAFEFCGFMVAHRVHLGLIQAASLLPWGLWCIEKIRTNPRAALGWMAPVFALTLAAGHWPTAVHLVVIWLAYLMLRGRPMARALMVGAAAVAIASAILAPQILATASYLQQTVRSDVPYSVAGENSFFPLAAILAFFPFIMGGGTPNFFSQRWWGPWHMSEMLGYVGLVTLVLAFGAIWRLYRTKKKPRDDRGRPAPVTPADDETPGSGGPPGGWRESRNLVRVWTWILIGAGIWALGYYLPTYRLIHAIPVLGTVRCPARMLLAIDFALVALAAIGIDAMVRNPSARLGGTIRFAAAVLLPACMFVSLALPALAAAGDGRFWQLGWFLSIRPGSDGAKTILSAMNPTSPAVYVPLFLAAVTIGALWLFVGSPKRKAWLLTALVLLDLFFIARFVDVPGGGRSRPDPQRSPAARWLDANAPSGEPYRLWGLSRSYHHRPAELLLPKTCAAMGFETISYYGPFQPGEHARLFGFRSWGENYEWAWLIRRNHLLSLFNVRYILAAEPEFRRVIESVRIPAGLPPPDGPNLLAGEWAMGLAERDDGIMRFERRRIWSPSEARRNVTLEAGKVYRIRLDARAPAGAGDCLIAEYAAGPDVPALGRPDSPASLRIDVERLAGRWRHFERTFRLPPEAEGQGVFRILSNSDRPIEVRNVSLSRSSLPAPINLGQRLRPGQSVYVDRTPQGLPPVTPGDPRVHIYENRLALPRSFPVETILLDDNEQVIEALRWRAQEYDLTRQALVSPPADPERRAIFSSVNGVLFDYLTGRKRTCRLANGLGSVAGGKARAEGSFSSLGKSPWLLPVQGAAAGIYLLAMFVLPRRLNRFRPIVV